MVFYAHLGFEVDSCSETSYSSISEMESSLTSSHCLGEEHSLGASSKSGIISSSNCTLLSMKILFVDVSNRLYPFMSSPYPTVMHFFFSISSSFLKEFEPMSLSQKSSNVKYLACDQTKPHKVFSLSLIFVDPLFECMKHD